jgi:hypothetical protein
MQLSNDLYYIGKGKDYNIIYEIYESTRRLKKEDLKIGSVYSVNNEKATLTDIDSVNKIYTFKTLNNIYELYYHNLSMEFYKNDSTMILGRYQMIKYPTYYLIREKINLSPKIILNKTGAIYTKLVGKTIGK